MRRLVKNVLIFALLVAMVLIAGLLLPVTKHASKSLLLVKPKKDSLLKHTPSPRLVLIGGSNLSFGINSAMLKDSLQLNPINTAVQANIGLKFMVDETSLHLRQGDVVIVAAEYQQFYSDLMYGKDELLRTVFDVSKQNAALLSFKQWVSILPFILHYSLSKFNINEYVGVNPERESLYYQWDSFNSYGDVAISPEQTTVFPVMQDFQGVFNSDAVVLLERFTQAMHTKGIRVYVTFACFQRSSYLNNINKIRAVESALLKAKLNVIGAANDYIYPDSCFFDTPYHLLKPARDKRTIKLINQFKAVKSH